MHFGFFRRNGTWRAFSSSTSATDLWTCHKFIVGTSYARFCEANLASCFLYMQMHENHLAMSFYGLHLRASYALTKWKLFFFLWVFPLEKVLCHLKTGGKRETHCVPLDTLDLFTETTASCLSGLIFLTS